jgi:membrane fusion protein (multidrug efflux system)
MRRPLKLFLAFIVMLGAVGLVIGGLGYFKFVQISGFIKMAASGAFAPPPTAVTTTIVRASGWQPTRAAIGTLAAIEGITASTDLAGTVAKIAFESGSAVKRGDLLVQLDISQEQAQLTQAVASRDLARLNRERNKGLLASHTISQSDYDSAEADFRSGQGAVDAIQAIIDKKTVRAPFDGVAGIRQINLGQYITAGQSMVSLQVFDPIYVNFYVPQQDLGKLTVGQTVSVAVDAFPDQTFQGKITALNSQVDPTSRNLQIQATVQNPGRKLRPGMFAQVSALLGDDEHVVAIPTSSISFGPEGESVYLLTEVTDKGGKKMKGVKLTPVQLGESRGDLTAIKQGLKPGDEIVTSGVFRLRDQAPVTINNKVKPQGELAPTPANS